MPTGRSGANQQCAAVSRFSINVRHASKCAVSDRRRKVATREDAKTGRNNRMRCASAPRCGNRENAKRGARVWTTMRWNAGDDVLFASGRHDSEPAVEKPLAR